MRPFVQFLVFLLLTLGVQCSGDPGQHKAQCRPTGTEGCAACGADYVSCGDVCYNPEAGEACCDNKYSCPVNFQCSTLLRCAPKDGKKRTSDCDEDKKGRPSTTASAEPSEIVTVNNVGQTSTVTTPAASTTAVSTASTASTVGTTSTTSTVTSTTTHTVTVTGTGSSCALAGSTTGITVHSSMAPFGNSTTIALSTTTSTKSLINASSTATPPPTSIPLNKTQNAPVSPPISGFKGGAAGLRGHSLLALGCLVFWSALLV